MQQSEIAPDLISDKRERFATQERRKSQDLFAQNSRKNSRLWDSISEQRGKKLIGCKLSVEELEELQKAQQVPQFRMVVGEIILFMKAIHQMMEDVQSWNQSQNNKMKKLQDDLAEIHQCVDSYHEKVEAVQDLMNGKKEKKKQGKQGRRDEKKDKDEKKEGNLMDSKSMYTIVAEQTKMLEADLKASVVKYLEQEKKVEELELINQDKWNHSIVDAISKVTKFRIVLFNARTRRYRDFGDLKVNEKIMIYVRGSDCALMRKGAKSGNGRRFGKQGPYGWRGQGDAYGTPWFYVPRGGADRGNQQFPGRRGYY